LPARRQASLNPARQTFSKSQKNKKKKKKERKILSSFFSIIGREREPVLQAVERGNNGNAEIL
jgi:hypothetical protein